MSTHSRTLPRLLNPLSTILKVSGRGVHDINSSFLACDLNRIRSKKSEAISSRSHDDAARTSLSPNDGNLVGGVVMGKEGEGLEVTGDNDVTGM